jgi:hypothetical protein
MATMEATPPLVATSTTTTTTTTTKSTISIPKKIKKILAFFSLCELFFCFRYCIDPSRYLNESDKYHFYREVKKRKRLERKQLCRPNTTLSKQEISVILSQRLKKAKRLRNKLKTNPLILKSLLQFKDQFKRSSTYVFSFLKQSNE